ncbi:MAG TPA: amino acid ABC transporter substrate-binding protein [Stellaceae bacterium]|nr:amino acid ABC transporter substrate-binding protein [Stellaceae bacterium]
MGKTSLKARYTCGAALGLVAALLAAPAASAADGPIVIGASASETGALAVDAAYHLHGLELGVAEANAHGGWLGRKIELKYYDDKSEPGTAVRLYTRLITEDKVDLIIGPYSSGVTQAVAPLANKYQRLMIDPGASLPDIFVEGNLWNIQGIATSTGYLEGILALAKEHGAHNVAVLALQSAYSLACGKARQEQAQKLGMPVVYNTTYALPQPDFSSIALAVKSANPDVVVACSYYPDSVGLAQALQREGFAPKFLGETIGPAEGQFTSAVGPIANRIMSNTTWWPSLKTPGNAEFLAAYRAKYHEDPDYHAAATYSAIEMLGAAVTATKSLDQAKLRDWLMQHSVETVQGTFKAGPFGIGTQFKQYMFQIQNGERKLIWPAALAEAQPQIPYTGH